MSDPKMVELMILQDIRAILEPTPGKLMQSELVELVRQTKERAINAEAYLSVLDGSSCAENQADGRGPCGCCKVCLRNRAEAAEAKVMELKIILEETIGPIGYAEKKAESRDQSVYYLELIRKAALATTEGPE